MNKALSIILCRIIALYFIMFGLSSFPSLAITLKQIDQQQLHFSAEIYLFGAVLLPMFLGIFLFWKSGVISLIISSSTVEKAQLDDTGIIRAGTFIIGVWFLFSGINELTSFFAYLHYVGSLYANITGYIEEATLERFTLVIINFILGVFLIFGSKIFIKIYQKIKYF